MADSRLAGFNRPGNHGVLLFHGIYCIWSTTCVCVARIVKLTLGLDNQVGHAIQQLYMGR
jgi:hypothetical protein